MRVAINAAIFNEQGGLLIVEKKKTWTLPGGKPHLEERDEPCLEREVDEELSGTKIKIDGFYGEFNGVSPNRGDLMAVRVYSSSLVGDLGKPSREIDKSAWMRYEEREKYNLSDATKKIVKSLRADNRFTGF